VTSEVWVPVLGLLAWLCCLTLRPVQGGKVLAMPVDGSHWLSMKLLVKELSLRGHEVIVLVPETSMLIHGSDDFQTKIFKVPFTKAKLDENLGLLRDGVFVKTPLIKDIFVNMDRLINFTSFQVISCNSLLHNRPLMSQLRAENYDLVLTDPFLPCGPVLAKDFSIPAVYFLRGLPCELDVKAAQCPSPPSFIPFKNMLMYIVHSYVCRVTYAHFDELVSTYLKNDMTYKDLIGEGAIWLLRYDFTFEWPRPLMPNMILIGGINCAKNSASSLISLQDLKEFVDGSGDHGFVVFTLGSFVSHMPEEKAKLFFDAFRRIPQRVVWRYTGALPKDVPENVKVMKWLPQNDLLGHPKVKAFITHGGTHGIYEAICNAVPMLMIPLFGDQRDNVIRMVARGVAETINLTLLLFIPSLFSSYKEKMTKLSAIHLDRPVKPLDLAVYWTEFVMRHKGASHLRPAAHHLNWIQYHSLDVIGFLAVILLTVTWLTLSCCLFCARKCCRRARPKGKQE
uniref:UDP-glucuronosyltransferase n=1 Tax=Myripristis murdjan TaxID=586833 RepID=A0A667Z518_9TELE